MLGRGIVVGVLWGLWGVGIFYWVVKAFGNKRSVYKQSRRSRLIYVVLAAAFVLGMHFVRRWQAVWLPQDVVIQAVGMACCAAGVGLAIWSRHVLGRNWSGLVTLKQEHELVRVGPYRWVRHPIYSGIILAMLGTVVALGAGLIGWCALLFAAVMLRIKSLQEERLLLRHFGPAYERYRRQVRALVPMVW